MLIDLTNFRWMRVLIVVAGLAALLAGDWLTVLLLLVIADYEWKVFRK